MVSVFLQQCHLNGPGGCDHVNLDMNFGPNHTDTQRQYNLYMMPIAKNVHMLRICGGAEVCGREIRPVEADRFREEGETFSDEILGIQSPASVKIIAKKFAKLPASLQRQAIFNVGGNNRKPVVYDFEPENDRYYILTEGILNPFL
jgi:hypothetical protein